MAIFIIRFFQKMTTAQFSNKGNSIHLFAVSLKNESLKFVKLSFNLHEHFNI